MKKVFVQYPGLRSSTLARRTKNGIKYRDPCVDEKGKIICKNCKTFVISDRFLGDDNQIKYAGTLKKFPFVIIVDTAGCNLRCWFCYSHHFWSLKRSAKKGCKPTLLSSEEITNQIKCKIKKIKSLEGQMDKKPFMRIRVSGGEPLFASEDTVQPYNSDKKVDYKIGVDFWIEFFERLDPIIEELKNNEELYIVHENDWDIINSPWPSFIADSPNRVNIRFDTNGISFSNPEVSNYFIGKIYNLHKNDKLRNLKIWIDYSFKGATPTEYHWSQKLSLPTSSKNNDVDYDINKHPQYYGLKNLRRDIGEIRDKDRDFVEVVDITVEKGIDHDREHRIYVYNPEAFNWNTLAQKANIKFSPVKNDMCLVYTYGGGPWGLFRSRGLLNRYFNRGAVLTLFSNDDEISLLPNDSEAVNKALNFMDRHNKEEKYFGILSLEKVKIDKEEAEKIAQKYSERKKRTRRDINVEGWVLSGSMTNWMVALSKNMWGSHAKYKEEWENLLKEGQYLFFYVTRPISGIIGYGKVREKIVGKEPLWPDEIEINKVKYPLRWFFQSIFILQREKWNSNSISLKEIGIPFFGGMNALFRKEDFARLAQLIKERWGRVI